MTAAWAHDELLHAYWVEPARILAGEYPGDIEPERARRKIGLLIDNGVRTFVDLTQPVDGLVPYNELLADIAEDRGVNVVRIAHPIPDVSVIGHDGYDAIVRTVRNASNGGVVYIHCWGGIGRTGTVVGCLLVDDGLTAEAALDRVNELRSVTRKRHRASPEAPSQIEIVRARERRHLGPHSAEPADRLQRFLDAQDGGHAGGSYADALRELRAGAKRSHWMWFVFPQLRGLGQSSMSTRYGIADLDEARAYLAHPVLGPRLIACADAALGIAEGTLEQVFGPLDAQKLHASATLFDLADPGEPSFMNLRWRFFHGHQHAETLAIMGPGHYVFTEGVLAAAESTPLWSAYPYFRDNRTRIHDYFMRMIGMEAASEDEMALAKLGGNNMGGGVPIDILRLLARLSRIRP